MNGINPKTPRWMFYLLLIAGVYNVAWGVLALVFPRAYFLWLEIAPPQYASLVQCIGMIVGVYGVGYAIAAFDPARHWPIVLVGLLGKIFGPIGFVVSAIAGELPWQAGFTLIFNDICWWIPFVLILLFARKIHTATDSVVSA